MRAHTTWLSQAEKELIVDEACGLLERQGMRFGACAALDLLEAEGAVVDRGAGTARLPRALVERALAPCPRTVVLGGATPDDDCVLDGTDVHFLPSGSPTHVLDHETGAYRASTVDDLRRATALCDAMPAVDIMWPAVTATEVPDHQRSLVDLVTVLSATTKHTQHDVLHPRDVPPMLELLAVLGQGDEELRERPRLSLVCCTSSPLKVGGPLLDATIAMARHHVPVLVYPMPIAGATAPVTVAGTVTLNIAEFLGVAAAIALAAPGVPLMMGAGASLLDMRAGTFSFGALETALMVAAIAEVSHHLGFPVLCPGLATDAKAHGIQAGYEKALKGLFVAEAGADLITGGIGLLGGAGILSLPQIVIDAEIAAMIKRMLGEVEVSAETAATASVERAGYDGHFLGDRETKRRLRAGEIFMPTISTRLSQEMWVAQGRDEYDVANEKVREILAAAETRGPLLDDSRRAALDAIIAGLPAD
ncbi:MAG: trimethylamine methyltransferase family protein [Thermoleophilia bacterium]|jgi:trimethylamine--corrinoid protein Co-methyltransferase|nr:trimethylamine methyltransferase family protein [Thermoleophilia bacterium]